MRTGNHLRGWRPVFYVFYAVLFLGGCSSSSDTTSTFIPGTGGGTHPADWLSIHPSYAVSDVSECTTCHGDDLTGGIADTSCFTAACHHEDPGWASPAAHGATAKRAPGNSGFKSCQICHASDFSGGGAGVSCFLCHASAPHPSQWRTGDTYVHTSADPGNASVCAQCHLAGANSPIAPPPSPAPGAQPGCFNNTLCHGAISGHPSGWSNPDSHGTAAKGAPSGSTGFAYCRVCHGSGTNFEGGIVNVSCLNNSACHGSGVQSPHSPQWLPGDSHVHTTTNEGNAPVCALCHYNEPGAGAHPPDPPPADVTVGCFNNTLCHGAEGHPAGWVAPGPPQPHGDSAKDPPGSTSGFTYCQVCHGDILSGGSSGVSCLNNASCHGGTLGINPHPADWLAGDNYVHTNTDPGNTTVCARCHTGGSTSPLPPPPDPPPGTPPGCFNNTLCHGAVTHAVPFLAHTGVTDATFSDPFPDGCASCHAVTGSSPVTSAPLCTTCHTGGSPLTIMNCTSCHAEPPAGAAYPDIAGSHVKHDALAGVTAICSTCHNGLDSGTQAHYDRANARPGEDALRVPPGDAVFPAKFNAKTGAASFNSSALTCANVSCHGGQTTPNWQTGTIDVNTNTGCLQCHDFGTGQFNSFNSGKHNLHVNEKGLQCRECHNMDLATPGAQNHFAFLGTIPMEGPASDTFQNSTGNVVYDTTANTCTGSCHEGHDNERWFGGD